jgi:hypothetical protein
MEIKEAINVFKKDLACSNQFKTNYSKCAQVMVCENQCQYYVLRELLTKAEQTVVEYFKNKINPSNNPCEECLEPKTNCKTCSFF